MMAGMGADRRALLSGLRQLFCPFSRWAWGCGQTGSREVLFCWLMDEDIYCIDNDNSKGRQIQIGLRGRARLYGRESILPFLL